MPLPPSGDDDVGVGGDRGLDPVGGEHPRAPQAIASSSVAIVPSRRSSADPNSAIARR